MLPVFKVPVLVEVDVAVFEVVVVEVFGAVLVGCLDVVGLVVFTVDVLEVVAVEVVACVDLVVVVGLIGAALFIISSQIFK